QLDAFGGYQRDLLLDQRILRLVQNANEIVLGQVLQLDTNGKSSLKLGHQVAGLGGVERAGGDEQNIVGADDAVARGDRAAFDDGEQIALHALAGDVRAVLAVGAGDFVELVEKNDAGLLDALDGGAMDLLAIDEFVGLLREEHFARFFYGHAARFALAGKHFF